MSATASRLAASSPCRKGMSARGVEAAAQFAPGVDPSRGLQRRRVERDRLQLVLERSDRALGSLSPRRQADRVVAQALNLVAPRGRRRRQIVERREPLSASRNAARCGSGAELALDSSSRARRSLKLVAATA